MQEFGGETSWDEISGSRCGERKDDLSSGISQHKISEDTVFISRDVTKSATMV
jgi:hypothetical protein